MLMKSGSVCTVLYCRPLSDGLAVVCWSVLYCRAETVAFSCLRCVDLPERFLPGSEARGLDEAAGIRLE